MNCHFTRFLICLLIVSTGTGLGAAVESLRISNNHPFAIRESLSFPLPAELADHDGRILAVSHSVTGGTVEAHYLPVQLAPAHNSQPAKGWIDAQLRPGESRTYTFQTIGGSAGQPPSPVQVTRSFPSGLPQTVEWTAETRTDLFDVAWTRPSPENTAPSGELSSIRFEPTGESHGVVKSELRFRSVSNPEGAPAIEIRYHLYTSGITDIEINIDESASGESRLGLAKIVTAPEGAATVRRNGSIEPIDTSLDGRSSWFAWQTDGANGSQAILPRNQVAGEQVFQRESDWLLVASTAGVYRILPAKPRTPAEVDQAFVAFAGYREQRQTADELHVSFGVPGVRFGANLPLPGTGDASLDDFQRNLRITNALGLEWIRLTDVDSSITSDSAIQSLETALDTIRDSGLKTMLSLAMSRSEAEAILERLGDRVGLYELADDDNDAPLTQSLHLAPEDSLDSLKDAVLALALGARKENRQPVVISFDPGFDAEQSDEEQANRLFQAYETVLSQGSLGLVFHHAFAESSNGADPIPALIRADGTPTIKAQAFHELIRRHSSADHPSKQLQIRMPVVSLPPGVTRTVQVTFTNPGTRPLEITTALRLPPGLTGDDSETTFTLRPRQSHTIERRISAGAEVEPGTYHFFEDARFGEVVRTGWGYAIRR